MGIRGWVLPCCTWHTYLHVCFCVWSMIEMYSIRTRVTWCFLRLRLYTSMHCRVFFPLQLVREPSTLFSFLSSIDNVCCHFLLVRNDFRYDFRIYGGDKIKRFEKTTLISMKRNSNKFTWLINEKFLSIYIESVGTTFFSNYFSTIVYCF